MDTRKRTFVKSIVWSAIGWMVMAVVGLVFTGSFVTGGVMAAINTLIGLACYVAYERVWSGITWGRFNA